jgi:hypothetical protein
MICKRCGGGVIRFVDELKCISCGHMYGIAEMADLPKSISTLSEAERHMLESSNSVSGRNPKHTALFLERVTEVRRLRDLGFGNHFIAKKMRIGVGLIGRYMNADI